MNPDTLIIFDEHIDYARVIKQKGDAHFHFHVKKCG